MAVFCLELMERFRSMRQKYFELGRCLFMVTRFSDVHKGWLDTADTPQISLRGAYLERMGFHIGMNIKIVVEKGRIVITPLDDLEEGEVV